MRLRILTPNDVLDDLEVGKVSAEGISGAFTILPRHIDVAAPLVPGILTAWKQGATDEVSEVYYAVDEGILVKKGTDVTVSVMEGIRGEQLEQLQETVEEEFMHLDERERKTRSSIAKIETRIARTFLEIER